MKQYTEVEPFDVIKAGDEVYSPQKNGYMPVPPFMIGTMPVIWPPTMIRREKPDPSQQVAGAEDNED